MQPNPVRPTNASPLNPYVGIDRGLFATRRPDYPYARIKSATWTCIGPTPSPGFLEYTLMGYSVLPTTPEEYAAGHPILNADGGHTFNCLTRGPSYEPIIVEFFATESYLGHYAQGGDPVTSSELSNANGIAARFVESMGGPFGVETVKMTVTFDQGDAGLPLVRKSMVVDYSGKKDGQDVTYSGEITTDPVDPVMFAMDHLKTQA